MFLCFSILFGMMVVGVVVVGPPLIYLTSPHFATEMHRMQWLQATDAHHKIPELPWKSVQAAVVPHYPVLTAACRAYSYFSFFFIADVHPPRSDGGWKRREKGVGRGPRQRGTRTSGFAMVASHLLQ